jgi:hypothetical protein
VNEHERRFAEMLRMAEPSPTYEAVRLRGRPFDASEPDSDSGAASGANERPRHFSPR